MNSFHMIRMPGDALNPFILETFWVMILSGPPSINTTDPDHLKVAVMRNDTVALLVELNVYPPPDNITWWYNNGSQNAIVPSDGYNVENTETSSKLIILSFQGNYTLTVFNTHGALLNEDGDLGVTFEVTSQSKFCLEVLCQLTCFETNICLVNPL